MCLIVLLLFMKCLFVCGTDIFHENTKATFYPDRWSEYFGFSVLLNRYGLLVGAPRGMIGNTKFGSVYNCSLSRIDANNVTCNPLQIGHIVDRHRKSNAYKDDSWFGGTIAALSDGKICMCAPRLLDKYSASYSLANGRCFLQHRGKFNMISPLIEKTRQVFATDGKRKEYGEYGTHLNYYAYGEAGMSMTVTTNNILIIGAPGLLQWTGGIIYYNFNPAEDSIFISKNTISNTYYTKDLGPDDYFGYSVDSGTFDDSAKVLFVSGAPRSKMGYGQVLVFEPAHREQDPLIIRAKIRGPQLGAYFGATLRCLDINGDGTTDILVGAPNFVKKDGGLPFDQGAVFVYMTQRKNSSFILEEREYISGSGESGARFGTAIANLGDINGDGYSDIAVGAPWENEGAGVVYIYRGNARGISRHYSQRIMAEGAKAFGMSISKGMDVDHNNCNDLAIGAHNSGTAYLYRCVPTVHVHATIKVPDAMNLPQNATGFTAIFCVTAADMPRWRHARVGVKAKITVDPDGNKASIRGDPNYSFTLKSGTERCDEQNVEVLPTADLSKPIAIKFDIEPDDIMKDDSPTFLIDAARISDESELHASFLLQLIRDCGDDLFCTPNLIMTLEPLDNPYVPGSETKLGVRLSIYNKEEPAYGAKVNITLPLVPLRIPGDCSLQELNMTCDVPAPLLRGQEVTWEIEMEYKRIEKNLTVVAELIDHLYRRNISDEAVRVLTLNVEPQSNISVRGKSLPNNTIPISREKLYYAENVSFAHYFELTNFGPSDCYNLQANITLSDKVNLTSTIKDCFQFNNVLECEWSLPAKVSLPVILSLRLDLERYGNLLKENITLNISTIISLRTSEDTFRTANITTTLVLDPASPIWPLVAAGLMAGLVLLALIVYLLYKYGFFSRKDRDKLKLLQEQNTEDSQGCSTDGLIQLDDTDESSRELIFDNDNEDEY